MHYTKSLHISYLDDEKIIKGILARDKTAEDMFYLKYRDKLLSYANRLCRNKDTSKDLIQDAVIITLIRIRNGKFNLYHEGHLLNSMKTTMRFTFNNQCKKSIANFELLETDIIEESEDIKERLFQAVEEAMIMIDEKCRQLICSFYMKKMSMIEITKTLPNVNTEHYARQFKYRCTKKLKSIALLILKEN